MLTRNKKILAVLAAVAAFAATAASAAALGGLSSESLGADLTMVASCDSDSVTISYTTTHNAATNSYQTTALTLSGVDASCTTKTYRVALDSDTTTLFSGSGTVAPTSGRQTIAVSPAVNAGAVTQSSLVITG